MSIFKKTQYRDVIESELARNAHVRGYKSRLAKAGGFHVAYLSQILLGHANLTPDQACLLCEFWGFDDRMTEFFLTLVNLERAASPALRKRLRERLLGLRAPAEKFQNVNVADISFSHKKAEAFFSNCDYSAVFAALDIPELKEESKLADFLKVHPTRVRVILEGLKEMQLVRFTPKGWVKSVADHLVMHDNRYLSQSFMNSLHARLMQAYVFDYSSISSSGILPLTADQYHKVRSEINELMLRVSSLPAGRAELVAGISLNLFRF